MDAGAGSLSWVDDFIASIRAHVFVREKDRVLIRMPNEAFKLNASGLKVLKYLLDGGSIHALAGSGLFTGEMLRETLGFLRNLAVMLSGDFCENYSAPSLYTVPFHAGYIELPILSEIALTYRCNVRCRFCYAACDVGSPSGEREMTTGEVKRVLRVIYRDAEAPSVSFTGGEPTLRRDLCELVRYAAETLGMRVNLITNGVAITRDMARALKSAGLASAQVSIESPVPGIHDEVVGVDGAHAASVRGLEHLLQEGIIVHPHVTICSLNREGMLAYPGFARSLGVERFSANLVIPAGRGMEKDLQVPYSEIGALVEELQEASRRQGVRFLWYSPTPLCLFNPVAHQLGNKGCSACEGLLSVDPHGNVIPCSSWREPVGNLLEEPFEAVWFSGRARYIREKKEAHPECAACEDFQVCQGACPLYFKAHGYAEIAASLETLRARRTQCEIGI